ncbi:MAG: hypothetical protein KAR21_12455, partial [Spirochaetales bacterium]|nr:hypothetical protein [Spirochaetales bacterium]
KHKMHSKTTTLTFTVESGMVENFFSFLQGGFTVKVNVGCSIKDYLCTQCGIEREYIANRVSTIFLDYKLVDDIDSAVIYNDSILALSGAMPGLVGAVMRVGSYYASFRSSITYKENLENHRSEHGRIRLKLFNLVMRELGPGFLERGIYIESEDLTDFLFKQQDDFRHGCRNILMDGEPVKFEDLMDTQSSIQSSSVFITVIT